jgi:histidine triad (HIT) family protein
MSDCIFCKIITGEIPAEFVYQDDTVIVVNDLHPQAPVHMLVIPKKHVIDIMDMSRGEYATFMQSIRDVIAAKRVKKFRLVHNGKGAQFIPHAHVHIMGQISADRTL